MSVRPVILLAALAVLAPAGSARADESVEERLRNLAPTLVLGPDGEEPGARLLVRERGRSLCVDVAPDRSGSSYDPGACGGIPLLDVREPFVLDIDRGPDDELGGEPPAPPQRTVGGAVRAAVAAVEYDVVRGGRIRIPTEAAPPPLAGRAAGELRFFLGTLPPTGDVHARRLIAADGTLLAEEDSPFGIDDRPPVRGPVRIASGRRWGLLASIERTLEPRLGDPGHRDRSLCVRLRVFAGILGGSGLSGACLPLPLEQPYLDFEAACGGAGRQVVYGAAPRGRAPVSAQLTDGRRLPVRARPVPASFAADAVAYAVAVPPGAGVRAVTMPRGERPRRVAVGLPPDGLLPCGGVFTRGPWDDLGDDAASPGGDVDVAPPGSAPLFVRDDGDALCLGAGRPASADGCAAPGPFLDDALVAHSADGLTVGGAVHPRVARVRLRLAGGRTMDVATHAGAGYTGRYAGRLRFFGATAPARPLFVDLLDDRGRVFGWTGFQDPRLAAPARRLLRVRGGGAVVAAPLDRALRSTGGTCVTLVRGAPPRAGAECDGDVVLEAVVGRVDCAPRAAVVVVGVSARARRVVVRLGDGTRRVVAVRRLSDRDRAAVFVPPARAAVRGITVRGRSGAVLERYRARIPPAARQCGYGMFVLPPGVS